MKRKSIVFLTLLLVAGIGIAAFLYIRQITQIHPQPSRPGLPSSAEVLSACDVASQSLAMHAAAIPDWSASGISTCYQLKLTIDPSLSTYQASARVTTSNLTTADYSDLVFRLYPNSPLIYGGNIEITRVSIGNQPVVFQYLLDRTALRIILPDPLKSGQSTVIRLDYSFSLPFNFGSDRVYGIFNQSTKDTILTLANWYPIMAVRQENTWSLSPVDGLGDAVTSETSLYLAEIITPSGWKIASTGIELTQSIQSDGVSHQFASGPARDFMLVASPSFEETTLVDDGITIRQWGVRETAARWDQALDVAKSSLRFYSQLYGKYPFKELDIVAVPLNLALGVEYPGLVLIVDRDYEPNPATSGDLTVVLAHEVAHQWWYSAVGNDVSAYPWQDEALTTFSTYDFLREYSPNIHQYLQNSYRQRVSALELAGGESSFTRPVSGYLSQPSTYGILVYIKGALFFDALKSQIGEGPFNAALKSYYSSNLYQIATPEELLAQFSTTCKCDLTGFYNKWGIPLAP